MNRIPPLTTPFTTWLQNGSSDLEEVTWLGFQTVADLAGLLDVGLQDPDRKGIHSYFMNRQMAALTWKK